MAEPILTDARYKEIDKAIVLIKAKYSHFFEEDPKLDWDECVDFINEAATRIPECFSLHGGRLQKHCFSGEWGLLWPQVSSVIHLLNMIDNNRK